MAHLGTFSANMTMNGHLKALLIKSINLNNLAKNQTLFNQYLISF